MILHNLHAVPDDRFISLEIHDGVIRSVSEARNFSADSFKSGSLIFKDAMVFPGLINSHEHLDFNLFPRLGHGIYDNYKEWGRDIHEKDKDLIAEVLKVPISLRTQWGIYKNLLNGVTTVVNHGPRLRSE